MRPRIEFSQHPQLPFEEWQEDEVEVLNDVPNLFQSFLMMPRLQFLFHRPLF